MLSFLRSAFRYGAAGMTLVLAVAGATVDQARAAPAQVTRVTAAETAREIEVLVVASRPVHYRLVAVRPNWIVVDVLGAQLSIRPGPLPVTGPRVRRVRVGQFNRDVVRVVIELDRPMAFRVVASDSDGTLLVRIPTGPVSRPAPIQARATPPPADPGPEVAAGSPGAALPSQAGAQRAVPVVPGRGIGAVRLGMGVRDVVAVLGPWSSTATLPDGSGIYRWFAPPANRGVGVRVTPAGAVYRIWVLNDARYAIEGRVRAGSGEAEVRAALGEPQGVTVDSRLGMKVLTYSSLGVWVGIQLNKQYAYDDAVFEIGVMESNAASRAGH